MSREKVGTELVDVKFAAPEFWEWLRTRYEMWNEGGPNAMVEQAWDPEIVYHDPPDFPDAGVRRGAQALAEHLEGRLEALGHATVTLRSAWWIGEGEKILVELTLHSGGKASGVQLDAPLFHVLRIRDGRVIEFWEFMRREHALEALGLRE